MRKVSILAFIVLSLCSAVYFFSHTTPEGERQPSSPRADASGGNATPTSSSAPHQKKGSDPSEKTAAERMATSNPSQTKNLPAPLPPFDITTASAETLYPLTKDDKYLASLNKHDFFLLINRLSELSRQNQTAAADALVVLTHQCPEEETFHRVLQALGQSGAPQAESALLEALQNYLGEPIPVTRIVSYLPKENRMISENAVNALFTLAQSEETPPDVQKILLNAVFQQGGPRGRQLIKDNDLLRLLHEKRVN